MGNRLTLMVMMGLPMVRLCHGNGSKGSDDDLTEHFMLFENICLDDL